MDRSKLADFVVMKIVKLLHACRSWYLSW